jgi:hypothetical protein
MSNYPDDMNHAALDVSRSQAVAARAAQAEALGCRDYNERYLLELKALSFNDAHARCDELGDKDEDFCVNAIRVLWPEFDDYYTAWDKQVKASRLIYFRQRITANAPISIGAAS